MVLESSSLCCVSGLAWAAWIRILAKSTDETPAMGTVLESFTDRGEPSRITDMGFYYNPFH